MSTDNLLTELRRQADPVHGQQESSGHDGVPLSQIRTMLVQCQERLHRLDQESIPVGEQGFLLVRFQEPSREEQADFHEDQCDPSARPVACEESD